MPARRFTDDTEIEITKRYVSGIGTVILANDYKTTPNVIRAVLNRQGLTPRTKDEARQFTRANVDESLFAGPELSEREQYWIGFLLADGYISKNSQSKHMRVNIKLHVKDIDHLEKFNLFLSAGNSIFTYGDDCCVSIVSDALVTNLAQWGIIQRKTFVAAAHPDLAYSNHFWRGYVDGDGYLGFDRSSKNPSPRLSIVCGSTALIEHFLMYCKSIVGYKTKANARKSSRSIGVSYGAASAKKLVAAMYSDAIVFLDRKHETAKEIMAWEGKYTKQLPLHTSGGIQ